MIDVIPDFIDCRKNLFIQLDDLIELLAHIIQAFHGRIRVCTTEELGQFFRKFHTRNQRDQVDG
ncbi:hypothetical protein ASF26_15815 [Methylobacterium sp. Leaf93]|nr:hypothetical protein ASF26_15815 [Methylobacterium sp. Leaf93]